MSIALVALDPASLVTDGLSSNGVAIPAIPTTPYVPPAEPLSADRMPDGGYLLPLYPRSFFRDPAAVAAQVLGLIDLALDLYRQANTEMANRQTLVTAEGQALDRFFGALLGVPRLTGEGDNAYRTRMRVTTRHGLRSVTPAGLATALGAILGVPVTATEGPGPARGTVTILQNTAATPQAIMAFVRMLKPFGVVVSVRVRTAAPPSAGTARLGAFRIGTRVLSGSSSFVTIG